MCMKCIKKYNIDTCIYRTIIMFRPSNMFLITIQGINLSTDTGLTQDLYFFVKLILQYIMARIMVNRDKTKIYYKDWFQNEIFAIAIISGLASALTNVLCIIVTPMVSCPRIPTP